MTVCRTKRKPHHFPYNNVLGLPGRVFGRHWHQKTGPKVPIDNPEYRKEARILWPRKNNSAILARRPIIYAHGGFWVLFDSDLGRVERGTEFQIRKYCRALCAQSDSRKPIILEWGCGAGYAIRDLTMDPNIKGKALIYGYADTWDECWNDISGVKFLFFVKEHLVEYFKRSKQRIDFIFSHAGLSHLHGDDLLRHLSSLATLMDPGSLIVSTRINRDETDSLQDFVPLDTTDLGNELSGECVLVRK
jgi:hypothetical protein